MLFQNLQDWLDRREVRRLHHTLPRRHRVNEQGADAGTRRHGQTRLADSPTELGIEAHVRELAERRRDRTHRSVRPLAELIDRSRFPEQDRDFSAILREQGGRTERALAESRGIFHHHHEAQVSASAELGRFAVASGCSESEEFSRDDRALYVSTGLFVIVEAIAGGGVFGEATKGGVIEASALGAAIGLANVLCGVLAGMARQASWGRSRSIRLAAVALPALAATVLTLGAGHYRAALAAGARDPGAAAIASFFSQPFVPLASLTVQVLAIVGACAFAHTMRTWLKIYGRVPGHRERAMAVLRRREAFDAAVAGAKALIVSITEEAKSRGRALLERAARRRDSSAQATGGICDSVARYSGEAETMGKAWSAANAAYAAAASATAGVAWASRALPPDWVPPLAIEDPRPAADEIDQHSNAVERAFAEAVQTMEKVGAAAVDQVSVMAKAIVRGEDILPDLPPSGGAGKGGFIGRQE